MIDVYVVHNDPSIEDRIKEANTSKNFFIHFIDEGTLKGKKQAFKLKGAWGARLTPFVALFENDKIVKAFYSEADNDVINSLIKYFNE